MSAATDAGAPAHAATGVPAARRQSSFGVAFRVLPPEQRHALDALYGFCRAVDDAVDEASSPDEARRELAAWRRALDGIFSGRPFQSDGEGPGQGQRDGENSLPADIALVTDLGAAVRRYPIRKDDLEALVEGCAWDLDGVRYPNWAALRAYCVRVASGVGLASIEIFGYQNPRTRDYAIDLGIALQLTNILRDVDEDAARGRFYLPADDLAAFGVEEADLVRAGRDGRRPPAVERLLHFEAARARDHYARARAALSSVERAHLVAAELMRDVYAALLDRLERRHFPRGRVALSRFTKLRVVLRRLAITRLIRVGERASGRRLSSSTA